MVYCLQRTTNRYFSEQHLKGVEQFQSKGPRGGSESWSKSIIVDKTRLNIDKFSIFYSVSTSVSPESLTLGSIALQRAPPVLLDIAFPFDDEMLVLLFCGLMTSLTSCSYSFVDVALKRRPSFIRIVIDWVSMIVPDNFIGVISYISCGRRGRAGLDAWYW